MKNEIFARVIGKTGCAQCKYGEKWDDDKYHCLKEIGTENSSLHSGNWFCADFKEKNSCDADDSGIMVATEQRYIYEGNGCCWIENPKWKTKENEQMRFGEAIERAKDGAKIQRTGWNGKHQYVELATCISYMNAGGEVVNANHAAIGNQALAFVGTSGVQIGWLASQADMLADDWKIL